MAPLWRLCDDGKLDKVRSALARGKDVNDKSPNGRTALMYAVMNKHNSIVKLLLDQPGVKINAKDSLNRTALHYAAWANNPEAARMLLLHPTMDCANATTNFGETGVGVNDTQIDSIQYLNFANKLFNSIFNSILFHKNSIQKIIQFQKS